MPEGLFGIRVQFVLGGTGLRLARDANELRPAVPSPGAVLFYAFTAMARSGFHIQRSRPVIHFLEIFSAGFTRGCVLIHSGGR